MFAYTKMLKVRSPCQQRLVSQQPKISLVTKKVLYHTHTTRFCIYVLLFGLKTTHIYCVCVAPTLTLTLL